MLDMQSIHILWDCATLVIPYEFYEMITHAFLITEQNASI